MAPLYGVLGYPVKHSLSPAMFGAAFYAYDMDARYEHFEVHPDDIRMFLKEAREKPIMGFSVTIPHKESIMPFLDGLDKHARAIGAVNTVANVNGKLKGYNTDWSGAQKALEDVTELEGKSVLILGAGGSARAITYACAQAGAEVTVLNRTLKKAQELADQFNVNAGALNEISNYRPHILIHTTSVGMTPNVKESLVPADFFMRGMVVLDIVYNPLETKLVKDAKRAECRIVPGYKMLLYQGEKQFEIWFNKKPRTDKMEEALLERFKEF